MVLIGAGFGQRLIWTTAASLEGPLGATRRPFDIFGAAPSDGQRLRGNGFRVTEIELTPFVPAEAGTREQRTRGSGTAYHAAEC